MYLNAASQSALRTLQSINQNISNATTAISTGLSINSAADAPSYWSTAMSAQSTIGANNTVIDALSLGKAQLSTADAALSSVYDNLSEIQNLLVTAQSSGADRATLQTQISGIISDIQSLADAAISNDINFLSVNSGAAGYNGTVSVVGSFSTNSSGVTISTIDIDRSDTALIDPGGGTAAGILDQSRTEGGTTVAFTAIDISALTDSAADLTTLGEIATIVDSVMDEVATAQSTIGVALTRTESQVSFLEGMNSAKEAALGELMGADVEEEAARLTALQAQQQLTVEALSIANSQSLYLLQLFR
ncbi:MAG: flagellin [Acuticoccus sp.]